MAEKKRAAVILCGSGFKDGSEIRESVATLWALSHLNITAQCYALNQPQADVVNTLTNELMLNESRNMLTESARIARGNVLELTTLNPNDYDCIVLPGGFGVAKNLCTFATEGAQGKVNPVLEKLLHEFYRQKKSIGAICISPALIALAFKGKNFSLTVGDTSEASQEVEKLGHQHIVCKPDECIVDSQNKVISTPAYMYHDAPLDKIFSGILKLIQAL